MVQLPTGVITALTPRKGNLRRWEVQIEGQVAAVVEEDVLVALGLQVGKEVGEEEWERLLAEEQVAGAFRSALRLIGARSRSGADLEKQLRRKGHDRTAVGRVMERLGQMSLIDDPRHGRELLEYLMGRGLGYWGLMARLRKDGLGRELAEQLLAERYDEEVERRQAEKLVEELASRLEQLPAPQRRERTYQLLRRRGFRGEIIADLMAGDTDE